MTRSRQRYSQLRKRTNHDICFLFAHCYKQSTHSSRIAHTLSVFCQMASKLPTFVPGCAVKSFHEPKHTVVQDCGDFPGYLTLTPMGFRLRYPTEPQCSRPIFVPQIPPESELVARMQTITPAEAKILTARVNAMGDGAPIWLGTPASAGTVAQNKIATPVLNQKSVTKSVVAAAATKSCFCVGKCKH